LATQLNLIGAELANQRQLLANGLTPSNRVLALERDQADLKGREGGLVASRAQNEGRATEIDLEILRLAAARREEAIIQLRDIGQVELELAERRRSLTERIAQLEIRAPVSGIVLGLQVNTPRAVVRPAEALLHLVPQDRALIVAVQIPPFNIDEVHVGQDVRLVFSAFPSRTTPELWGKVAVLSADALTDETTGQPYYRAEVVLNAAEIDKLEGRALLPGMPVETFIQTTARTPLSYLIQPFSDYFQRAFRES
jgi:HlyD family secretion protein